MTDAEHLEQYVADGTRVAEAAGLFIAIDFSRLGGDPDGEE